MREGEAQTTNDKLVASLKSTLGRPPPKKVELSGSSSAQSMYVPPKRRTVPSAKTDEVMQTPQQAHQQSQSQSQSEDQQMRSSEDDLEEEGESEQEEMNELQQDEQLHIELQNELEALEQSQERQAQDPDQQEEELDRLHEALSRTDSDSATARTQSQVNPLTDFFHCFKPGCDPTKRYSGRHQHKDRKRVTKAEIDRGDMFEDCVDPATCSHCKRKCIFQL